MQQKEIIIKVNKEDYDLLNDYGLLFERTIAEYIHELAEDLREQIKQNEERNIKNYD